MNEKYRWSFLTHIVDIVHDTISIPALISKLHWQVSRERYIFHLLTHSFHHPSIHLSITNIAICYCNDGILICFIDKSAFIKMMGYRLEQRAGNEGLKIFWMYVMIVGNVCIWLYLKG